MNFSDSLWKHITPIYQHIIAHPFNRELAEGLLDEEKFLFYMQQDAYYLIEFSRALALIAGRAISSKIIFPFLHFALGTLTSERQLHAQFLVHNDQNDPIEPSTACIGYTQYLIATAATAPIEEAIAAVLPCFWIYREVGRHIAERSTENNPYIKWIDTYSSQNFSDGVNQAIALLDEVASSCSTTTLARMKKAFEYSALFEWHFWNDAYHKTVFRPSALTARACLAV
jgi:thiaminase/transcriptional activator TenA